MKKTVRAENDIFIDLTKLCSSAGYAHAIAYFCFEDNFIHYIDTIKPENILPTYSRKRLVRTEISTLIGLMCKADLDLSLPDFDTIQHYINSTDSLLEEIHYSMSAPMIGSLDPNKISQKEFDPFAYGSAMREPIFYNGESVYSFQYRDIAPQKYSRDNHWFKENKGFSIEDVRQVISCITNIQNKKLSNLTKSEDKTADDWSLLPHFIFTIDEIVNQINLERSVINNILKAFTLPNEMHNQEFNALNDFNIANAYPIIKLRDDEYLLFQIYSLTEAFYETPFFWLNDDKTYLDEAMKNRGIFTEEFSKVRLEFVFGGNRVFPNVEIVDSKKNNKGEIDVLVVFANKAIILQAKSKKLTIEARKGNDRILKDDFKKSIQDSYDQALSCAKLITDENYKLLDANNKELEISRKFKEILLLCVVSDHYPALSYQTLQFLKYEQSEVIMAPLVMDIFALDVISEMLYSPLQFISYIENRAIHFNRVLAPNELTILAHHLRENLWVNTEYDMVCLDDNIGIDIDAAMLVRREGLPGNAIPEGILKRTKDTAIGKLIQEIEMLEDPETIELGLMLLKMREETIYEVSKGIETIANHAIKDGKTHDLSVSISDYSIGLTIHCNIDSIEVAGPRLQLHCEKRKYSQRAEKWFGICIDPNSQSLKFGIMLDFKWKWSKLMEHELKDFTAISGNPQYIMKEKNGNKIGRNELCPCGSGIKYKKCCGG